MLITVTAILSGLSSDVRKQSFIESYVNDDLTYQVEYPYNELDFNNNYYLNNTGESKRIQVLNELEKEILNKNVRRNAIGVIQSLPALFLMDFDINNLYESSYGTAILEYVIKDANFTIDIGEKSFGYFSEIHGEFSVINEEFSSEGNEKDLSLGRLNKDFIDFYNSL